MKYICVFLILISFASCQITETINLNSDGSGNIDIYTLRDENSVNQLGRQNFGSEKFRDTIFTFQDYITKYQETFVRFTKADQALFTEHTNVKMHIKVDPIQMENFNRVSVNFKKIDEVPNVYETLGLANSLKENYPIYKKSYKIKYSFDGIIFKRNLMITDQEGFEKDKKEWEERKKIYSKYKLMESYILNYHFPRKIKSVSNEKAILSSDKKSLTVEFQLSDCLQNPQITNLEVVLEPKDFQ
ncbi:hypothetical protein SAMN06265349_1021032 [Flavobacterium resistens]|uniref:Lipoprotein n=1 Tax=Flavobacterium resistens TaxID=443612 RepID=A0A521CZQ9_9FLAO|nr:hypothetical protein [Flavobacterium resistens]MRX67097.1 hypothetical protein [Flavobacterium resistens]SMO64231.1 hypothetical protein SAMN06265349_1021032 [Flavobacterium resistens]